jgi:hypothetical protein
MLHLRLDLRVSHDRIVAMYFFASLTFLVAGLCLSSVIQQQGGAFQDSKGIWIASNPPPPTQPYLDLGLRLYAIGLFLVAATFYQSLVGEGRTSQKSRIAITKS